MTDLFIQVLSMSLTATYCIIFVCIVRLLLKKAPRIFSYVLWSVVAFRLICPISFESMFSLVGVDFLPFIQYEVFSQTNEDYENANFNIGEGEKIEESTSYNIEDNAIANENDNENLTEKEIAYHNFINNVNQTAIEQTSPDSFGNHSESIALQPEYAKTQTQMHTDLQAILLKIFTYIWLFVACILAGYGLFTFVRLKRKLKIYAKKTSVYINVDVWQVTGLDTPFVLGHFHPAIYLPENLTKEDCTQCLAHEYTHIRRKDYWIKQLAFLLVCVYWFNPFVWLAFYLMTKDMEMSCDEVAIRSTSLADRKAYSGTLLELSSAKKYFSGCPLAFGANSTKARIKHIMNYKRPSFWAMLFAMVLVVVCVVGLTTNPQSKEIIPADASNSSSILDEQTTDANIPVDNGDGDANLHVANAADVIEFTTTEATTIDDYYDLIIEYRKQYQELAVQYKEIKENSAQKKELSLYLERIDFQIELINEELSMMQLNPAYSQLQGPQYRLFAQIDNPEADDLENYIVMAYDTYTDIADAYSHKSMPESVYSSSVVNKLSKGDIVEVLHYGFLPDVPDELTSKYALICWEPENPTPNNCGYVRADYLNIDVPENTLASYLLFAGNYWANQNLITAQSEINFLPIYHINVTSPNDVVITYYEQESEYSIINHKQELKLDCAVEVLENIHSLSKLCDSVVSTAVMTAYGKIRSYEEFQTVYGGIEPPYSIFDFEGSGFTSLLMDNSKEAVRYADPITALENYLHLEGGKGMITAEEQLKNETTSVYVRYTFPDGYAAIIPMHQVNGKQSFWCIDYKKLNTFDIWNNIATTISDSTTDYVELLNIYTDYLNDHENNAFVTTSYDGETVNLAMLLYDAGTMLENAPLMSGEAELLLRENINEQEIMYHFTGEQIDYLLQEKMNLSLAEIKYQENIPNNLKSEWVYLEEFDTYTFPAKGDSKLEDIICTQIRWLYSGELLITYHTDAKNPWIKKAQLIMTPKTPDSSISSPEDYYFVANKFMEGGYDDETISASQLKRQLFLNELSSQ